jgi:hypothetical protein
VDLRHRDADRPGHHRRVIFIEQAQRRIPVQYAKRMVGRKMYGGSSTYIPLKVNQAGVIPVIFASSLLYLPALAVSSTRASPQPKWVAFLNDYLVGGDHPLYMALYFGLIIFFTYFYVSITFNPTRSRQHEEVRRLHPRDPGGQADRGLPRPTSCPGSRCRERSTSV